VSPGRRRKGEELVAENGDLTAVLYKEQRWEWLRSRVIQSSREDEGRKRREEERREK
jgi:hypothetical protein